MNRASVNASPTRQRLRRGLLNHIERRAQPYAEARLADSLMVIAPHQDDEVLGCGELVRQKRAAGATVSIVFVSDGSTSHRKFIGAEALRALRAQEALEAAARLGVDQTNVVMIGLPDGRLREHIGDAALALARVFEERRPREIALPHSWETTPDHVATWQATRLAATALPGTILLEYGVWIWRTWPIGPLAGDWFRARIRNIPSAAAAAFRLATAFNLRLPIARPDLKRRALAAYKTQVERPVGWPEWPVLSDVDGGNWLDALFGSAEYYRQSIVSGTPKAALQAHLASATTLDARAARLGPGKQYEIVSIG